MELKRLGTLALLAALLASPAAAAPIKIGLAIPSYAHGVVWIAKDAGIFEKNGLEAEVLVVQGSADAMRLLIAGQIDVALAGGDALVKADLAGGDLIAVAGIVNRFYHRIVAKADLRDPSDLKGRAIGLPILGGPQDMAVQAALKRWGLVYGKDVSVRNMGAEYARLAAVKQGLVDAVTSDAPPSTLRRLDLRVLGDVPSWGIPFPYMMAVVRRDSLKKNAKPAEAFLKALLEAMEYYRGHEKESLALLAKHLAQERGTEAEAAELYRQNGPSTYTFPPYPSPAGFKTVLESLAGKDPRAASAKPEDFFTYELLDRVRGSGDKPKK